MHTNGTFFALQDDNDEMYFERNQPKSKERDNEREDLNCSRPMLKLDGSEESIVP